MASLGMFIGYTLSIQPVTNVVKIHCTEKHKSLSGTDQINSIIVTDEVFKVALQLSGMLEAVLAETLQPSRGSFLDFLETPVEGISIGEPRNFIFRHFHTQRR